MQGKGADGVELHLTLLHAKGLDAVGLWPWWPLPP